MKTIIIAEAGVNHCGSYALAKKMVKMAANAGADFIKFQTFHPEALATNSAPKAEYQKKTTDGRESQKKMLEKLCLSAQQYKKLKKECRLRKIGFLSTPFDPKSLKFVETLQPRFHKISSGDIDNYPLLRQVASYGRPVLLSTGMSRMNEIRAALKILRKARLGRKKIVLLQCHTEYPTRADEANLRVMDTFRKKLGVRVGLSDHTMGIVVSLAAAARGAEVIEKHFTLDRSMKGPDHRASLSPPDFREMVRNIREIERAMGNGLKRPSKREKKIMRQARKYLVALDAIRRGEKFTSRNLGLKRCGGGIPAARYDQYLGTRADRDYQCDDAIRK